MANSINPNQAAPSGAAWSGYIQCLLRLPSPYSDKKAHKAFYLITGGTLKIYGETLKPDVPYKTLLLSTADTVQHVIKEAMEKYGVDTEDTTQFVLVEVGLTI